MASTPEHQAKSSPLRGGQPRPFLETATWFDKLTFGWMFDMIWNYGRKHGGITEAILPDVSPEEDVDMLAAKFERAWNRELARGRRSLWWALWDIAGVALVWAGLIGILESIAKVGQAICLSYLIKFFQNTSKEAKEGYLIALGLCICVLVQGVLHHHYFWPGMRAGYRVRAGLITFLYRRSLRLSMASSISTGSVVNLISNDVQPFDNGLPYLHYIWLGPVEIIMVFAFLYIKIGVASIVALGIFALVIPLQLYVSKLFAQYRVHTTEHRDNRIRLQSDVFSGIQTVKLSAWERPLERHIKALRELEYKYLHRANKLKALNEGLFVCSGEIVCLFAFITLWGITSYRGHPVAGAKGFTPAEVFPSMAFFNLVRQTVTNFVPRAFESFGEMRVSVRRITDFLLLAEESSTADSDGGGAEGSSTEKRSGDGIEGVVRIRDATLGFREKKSSSPLPHKETESDTGQSNAVLFDINLELHPKELLAIVGPVGCGKSSLCYAVLGELLTLRGSVLVNTPSCSISYASQSPWIFGGTIRDNILFGKPYEEAWFREVCRACALERDFESFDRRELSVIGERGAILSGGQRARVALARAVYCRADLYILDDPLSAVDPQVARYIFENVIRGLLRDKPCILVTHQLQFVRACDSVAVMKRGRIIKHGPSDRILGEIVADKDGNDFLGFLHEVSFAKGGSEDPGTDSAQSLRAQNESITVSKVACAPPAKHPVPAAASNDCLPAVAPTPASPPAVATVVPPVDLTTNSSSESMAPHKDKEAHELFKIGGAEESEEGTTPLWVYLRFFSFGGGYFGAFAAVVLLLLQQGAMMGADYYLAVWSSWAAGRQAEPRWVGLYVGLISLFIVLAFAASLALFEIVLRASNQLFVRMLESALAAPIEFFQAQPLGRILNRFSKDQANTDELLPFNFVDTVQIFAQVLSAVIFVCIANYWAVLTLPPLLAAFYLLRRLYMQASRQIKRIESVTRSPVYALLSESLEGLSTIRAFGSGTRFTQMFTAAQNRNGRAYLTFLGAARWLGLRLDTTTALFFCVAAMTTVAMRHTIRPSMVGLSLSYVLQLIGHAQWAVRQSVEVELCFISVERNIAYTQLPREEEPDEVADALELEGPWPEEGRIEIRDLSLHYFGSDRPALSKITLSLGKCEKIGVVGRTGAGKSSLLSCLFRLAGHLEGSLEIDGIEITRLRLADLRANLSIIPQEPFLFEGTLRFNVDPFNEHTDDEVWAALEAAELKRLVSALPDKLETRIVENGRNFSVGERQLISLARVVLRGKKLVVMDEPTANIDVQTDRIIQRSIHSQFRNMTVLTIAHRLHTVLCEGYDKILVLDQGQVKEFDEPWVLLQNSDGWLSRMVAETGPETAMMLRSTAKELYLKKHSHQQ